MDKPSQQSLQHNETQEADTSTEELKDANTTIGLGVGVGTLGVCSAIAVGAT